MIRKNPFPHGIDITAPGGLDALFAFNRARFGNATMEAGDGGAGGTGGGDGGEAGKGGDQGAGAGTGTGTGDQGKGSDHGKTGTEAVKTGEQGKGDVWDDPAAARAEIERLRRENGTDRVNAKTQAAEQAKNELIQSLGKTLGLVKDDNEKPDAAKLAQQLTDRDAAAVQAQRELAVYKVAGKNGGDPDALIDSRAFLAKIADLDPTKTDAIAAAVKDAVKDNPKLSAAQAAGKGGADFSGGTGEPRNKQQPKSLAEAVNGHYGT